MKWKNTLKKGSLSAMIALALTSTALAMPTGGSVEQGTVNVGTASFTANGAIGDLANGATVMPQTDSIINWETFNIGQSETLNFDTTMAAILNRVTGAQMSEILGKMTQVGAKPLFLVNPNGIHIGGTASFDVTNLTLSTLNMDTAEFNRPKGQGEWTLKQGAQGAKELRVDTGAQFNIHNGGSLALMASKVTVADGVTFVADSAEHGGLYIYAYKENTEGGTKRSLETEAGNTIDFRGKVSGVEYLEMNASSVHLEGAELAGKDIFICSIAKGQGEIDTTNHLDHQKYTMTAAPANTLTLKNTKVVGDKIMMSASNINIEGAELAGKDIAIRSIAKGQIEKTATDEITTMTAAPTNTLTVKNTKVTGDQIKMLGGKVDVAKDVNFKFAAGTNSARLDVVAVSNIVEKSNGTMPASTAQGNDVAFHATAESHADRKVEVNIGGATVNLDGAKFRMPKGRFSAVAIASAEDSYTEAAGVSTEKDVTKATAANVVQADGLDIEGNMRGTLLYGGKVDLKNTTIKTPGKIEIEAYTSREWTGKNHGDIIEKNLRAGIDNVVRLENTKLLSAAAEANGRIKWVQVYGGAVDIKGSELTSDHSVDVRALQSMDEVLKKDSHSPEYWYFPNYSTQKGEYRAGAGNHLQISNSKIHANLASWNRYERPDCYVAAIGGKVSLKDVDMKSPRDIDVYALREATGGDTVAGVIKSDTGNAADIEKMTLEAKGSARIWSGKTQMKNSSVQAGKIDLAAGVMKPLSNRSEESYPTTDLSNALFLENVKLKSQGNVMGYSGTTNLFGGQVSLKKSEIDAESVEIDSGKMKQDEDGKFYLTKGAPLHMDSTKIETPSYVSKSSVTNLVNGTEIKAQNAFFLAAQSFDGKIIKAYVTKDNTISLWGSKIEADFLSCKAGGINAWKESAVLSSQVIGEYPEYVTRTDGSAFTLQRDESSKIMENGIEPAAPRVTVTTAPDAPAAPLFPLTPDNAPLSEQDQENIAAGKSEAQGIIASAADTEAQGKALAEAVGKLNNVPNASSRQKAGVVTGMIQAINEMNTLTTEAKHALQVAVLDAYGAVQEAKTEGSNRTQQANGDAMRLTTMESAAANMPTAEEPQDAVHFAG